jgi:hypothetical protein
VKYLTKRVEVEAMQFTGTPSSAGEIAEWLGALEFRWDSQRLAGGEAGAVWVCDFAGSIDAVTDQWIVRLGSEFSVYSAADFLTKFETP